MRTAPRTTASCGSRYVQGTERRTPERAGAAAVLEVAALDGELVRTRSEIEREATALGRDAAAAVAGPGAGPGAAVAQVMAVAGVSRAAAESLLRRAGGRGVERAIDLHFSQWRGAGRAGAARQHRSVTSVCEQL